MFSLQQLVRKNILELQPYTSARSEYSASEGIFLDANENPYGTCNRYPDPLQQAVKEKLATLKSIPAGNIFIGNGSDEVIDLVFRIFCRPGIDKAMIFTPTYGMYEVAAAINDTALIKVPLDEHFQIDLTTLLPLLEKEQPKLLFICSPNNPTGNCLNGILPVLQQFKGIVVLDEAYIDFADRPSFVSQIEDYPNLLVVQTLSKARGLAAARIGIAYAQADLIALLNKVKPPYNVSTLNQHVALEALSDTATFEEIRSIIRLQRIWLKKELKKTGIVRKVYPSDANFLLVKMTDAPKIYNALIQQKIITRNRHSQVNNCLRITVGRPEENMALIRALQQIALSLSETQTNEESTIY